MPASSVKVPPWGNVALAIITVLVLVISAAMVYAINLIMRRSIDVSADAREKLSEKLARTTYAPGAHARPAP